MTGDICYVIMDHVMGPRNYIFLGLGGIVFLLLGAVLGGMFTKIQYLESKSGTVAGTTAPTGAPAAPTAPPTPTTANVKVLDTDPVKGDPKAKLTIVEFADYQCPFCQRFFKDVEPQLIKDYVDTGKAMFVFKDLAFLGKESTDAANAALCAKEQNKFWEYHDYLFSHQGAENSGTFAPDKLKGFAADLGLNASQFNTCLDSQKYSSQVAADQAEASKNGFNSTPSVAVGSTPIIGAQPYAQFKTAIEAELAKK